MAIEELEFGPRPVPRRSLLRFFVIAVVVAALVLGGVIGWQSYQRASPQFTLADLSNSYAAFTTNNGSNNVSTLRRSNFTEQPVTVSPAGCDPLIQPTIGSQFPATALDGVLVYSIGTGDVTSSLFTYRFTDARTARTAFDQVEQSLSQCRRVTIGPARRSGGGASDGPEPTSGQRADLREIPVDSTGGLRHQVAYLIELPEAKYRLSVNLLHYGNTVTWLYRYEPTRTEYSARPAQDLIGSLVLQMSDVLAQRP